MKFPEQSWNKPLGDGSGDSLVACNPTANLKRTEGEVSVGKGKEILLLILPYLTQFFLIYKDRHVCCVHVLLATVAVPDTFCSRSLFFFFKISFIYF